MHRYVMCLKILIKEEVVQQTPDLKEHCKTCFCSRGRRDKAKCGGEQNHDPLPSSTVVKLIWGIESQNPPLWGHNQLRFESGLEHSGPACTNHVKFPCWPPCHLCLPTSNADFVSSHLLWRRVTIRGSRRKEPWNNGHRQWGPLQRKEPQAQAVTYGSYFRCRWH